MPRKRGWTSSQKREVGARQGWKCAHCNVLLPATYEIDHKLALHNGGEDCLESNSAALCNACHSKKSILERIQMERARSEAIMHAKAKEQTAASSGPPLRGNKRLIEATPVHHEFISNKFLRFAYLKDEKRYIHT